MQDNNQIYTASQSGDEYFSGEYNSVKEALDAVFNNTQVEFACVGVPVTPAVKEFVYPERILEDVGSTADDECGEYTHGWLNSLLQDRDALVELQTLIADWIEQNEAVTFRKVVEIKEYLRSDWEKGIIEGKEV
jgi:hypothetical protein